MDSDGQYKCETCESIFKSMRNLRVHKVVHTGEKNFKCKVCGQSFKYKSELARHDKSHTGKKCFKCDECDKSFYLRQELIRHEKVHVQKKPFECKICKKCFSQPVHMRRVLGKYTDPKDHRPNTQTFNFLIIFSIRKIHRPFGKIHRPRKSPTKTQTILILVHLVI